MLKSVQFWCDKLFVAERMQLMTTPPSVRVHDLSRGIVMYRTLRCMDADLICPSFLFAGGLPHDIRAFESYDSDDVAFRELRKNPKLPKTPLSS